MQSFHFLPSCIDQSFIDAAFDQTLLVAGTAPDLGGNDFEIHLTGLARDDPASLPLRVRNVEYSANRCGMETSGATWSVPLVGVVHNISQRMGGASRRTTTQTDEAFTVPPQFDEALNAHIYHCRTLRCVGG